MNIDVDLSPLHKAVKQMGAEIISFDLSDIRDQRAFKLEKQLSESEGVDISLSEISETDGLLNYKGMQVLLFIPNQNKPLERVIENGSIGKKFHIAQCSKLDEMKRRNRFDRYSINRNLDGAFKVSGCYSDGREGSGIARLNVCQFCLGFLNYKGSDQSYEQRKKKCQRV